MEIKQSFTTILQRFLLVILFGILVLIILVQTNPATRRIGRDYGIYLYVGKEIYRGGLPYRDAWESKPPAIFYVDAFALMIGNGSRWGVWMLEVIFLLSAVCISYYLLNKLWGRWPALAGVFLWLAGLGLTLGEGNSTEEYPLPLHFLSILLFLKLIETPKNRGLNFLLGLTFGISFLFRPNNAAIEIAVILTLFLFSIIDRNLKSIWAQIVWVGLGGLTPIFLVGLYFWYQGILYDYIEAAYLYNFFYSTTQITSALPLKTGFGIFGGIAWAAVIGYLVAIIRIFRLPRGQDFYLYLFLLLCPLVTIYISDPAKRAYGHYFINWLPFIALLAGLAINFFVVQLQMNKSASPRWETIGLGMLILFAGIFFVSSGRSTEYGQTLKKLASHPKKDIEFSTKLAAYVRRHTKPDDFVLFWGSQLGENIMADRDTPGSILFFPSLVQSDITTKLNDRYLRELKTNKPILIVDTGYPVFLSIDPIERKKQLSEGFDKSLIPSNADQLFDFIDKNYYLITTVSDRPIYKLKDSSLP